jgi:hypothetical protein
MRYRGTDRGGGGSSKGFGGDGIVDDRINGRYRGAGGGATTVPWT